MRNIWSNVDIFHTLYHCWLWRSEEPWTKGCGQTLEAENNPQLRIIKELGAQFYSCMEPNYANNLNDYEGRFSPTASRKANGQHYLQWYLKKVKMPIVLLKWREVTKRCRLTTWAALRCRSLRFSLLGGYTKYFSSLTLKWRQCHK